MASVNSNGYMERMQNQYQGTSTATVIIVVLALVLIFGFLIYWGVSSRSSSSFGSQMNPVIISEPMNAFNNTEFKKGVTLPVSNQGMEFTYSFWMYIADWSFNFGNKKYIFVKGNTYTGDQTAWAPAIWLGENLNTLHTSMSTFSDNPNATATSSTGEQFSVCKVPDIPLQKWVYVSYVFNNRNIDIYINGKLEKSCMLAAVPKLNNSALYITPAIGSADDTVKVDAGFYGQLSNFQYFTRALLPNEVSDIYLNGPYASI